MFPRTYVPFIVGFLVERFTPLAEMFSVEELNGAITVGIGILYHLFPALAEIKIDSRFGWLLGVRGTPSYSGQNLNGFEEKLEKERQRLSSEPPAKFD